MTSERQPKRSNSKALKWIGPVVVLGLFLFSYIGGDAANIVPEDGVKAGKGVRKVVLDAGHGGKDPGALGANGLQEKDVALHIVLSLGKLIEKNHPDIEVIYTRKTDVFVELHERANIANKAGADLFISIHADAAANKQAYGTETFCLGLHANERNLRTMEIAKRENSVILEEEGHEENYGGFDPNDETSYIIFKLMQSVYLEQSRAIADNVQMQFTDLGRRNRGTKQAGFLVLYKTTMPSILVETGFITNPKEGEFLRNDANKDKLAEAIYKGFRAYNDKVTKKDETLSAAEAIETPVEETPVQQPVPDESPDLDSTASTAVKEPVAEPVVTEFEGKVTFGIQVATSMKSVDQNPAFKDNKEVWQYKSGQVYKYVIGKFGTQQEATARQQELRSDGFPDAFVVAFNQKGERITPQQVKALLGQ